MRREILVRVGLVVASLAALELAARALLLVVPALGDPWSGRLGSMMNGALVRDMERDLAVVARRQQLYLPDPTLFWRLAPDVDMEVDNEVLETRGEPVRWRIRTNDRGFRSPALPAPAPAQRILTLGDSCTFGFRVAEETTYAARLQATCASRAPGGASALNAGVPGYTSHQGKLLLAALLQTYRPTVVTIAFGTNDREGDALSDAERAARLDEPIGRLAHEARRLAVFRILSKLVLRPEAPGGTAPRPRVDVEAFRANVDEMIAMAKRSSAAVVLLDLVFVGPVYQEVLHSLATRWNVPLVDGRTTLDAAYVRIEQGVAYREETGAWRAFYVQNVRSIRPVYFDREFYRRHYPDERAEQQFITLMADPIHPSAIGHHVLADALARFVCPASGAAR